MMRYLGKVSVSTAIPVLGSAVATLDLAGLQAQLLGLLSLAASFTPPSILGIATFIADLQAKLQAGFQPPALNLTADLEAKIAALGAKVSLVVSLGELVASGGIRLYEFEGSSAAMGDELAAVLAGADADGGVSPTSSTFAVVLLADAGASIQTLKIIRGV